MCTAITFRADDFYFGRTLDMEFSYPQTVTFMPRNFELTFRNGTVLKNHYSVIGMAYVADDYPLYFDGINEKGLAAAGLNFVGNACYSQTVSGRDNIAQFEFIPLILAQCSNVGEAKHLLERINITDTPFSEQLPPAELHWIIADRNEAITVEAVKEGLRIYRNEVGVLTNNPPFNEQMFNLNNYINLSANPPTDNFAEGLKLSQYSRGMGALGLPGDMSSMSRFVRASFVKLNSVKDNTDISGVSQFFHIMGTVNQVDGMCRLGDGSTEKTIYTSCCNADKGIYYYTAYGNHQISAVDMKKENPDENKLKCYPLVGREKIYFHN